MEAAEEAVGWRWRWRWRRWRRRRRRRRRSRRRWDRRAGRRGRCRCVRAVVESRPVRRAIPARISSGTPISRASSQDRRSDRGGGMTCVAASLATGTIVPESSPTSARPSGGRSAGDLAIDSSATAGERRRRIGPERVDRRRCLVELAAEQIDRVRRLEREPAREHPVQDHAERVDVTRGCGGLSGSLLRRHVRGRSDQRAGLGQRVHTGHAGDAEVRDLGAPFLVEQDVRRLQVAVDEPVLVRVREPGRDLGRDRPRLGVGQAARPRPGAPRACRPAGARRP